MPFQESQRAKAKAWQFTSPRGSMAFPRSLAHLEDIYALGPAPSRGQSRDCI